MYCNQGLFVKEHLLQSCCSLLGCMWRSMRVHLCAAAPVGYKNVSPFLVSICLISSVPVEIFCTSSCLATLHIVHPSSITLYIAPDPKSRHGSTTLFQRMMPGTRKPNELVLASPWARAVTRGPQHNMRLSFLAASV